jgi:hypothetical protein
MEVAKILTYNFAPWFSYRSFFFLALGCCCISCMLHDVKYKFFGLSSLFFKLMDLLCWGASRSPVAHCIIDFLFLPIWSYKSKKKNPLEISRFKIKKCLNLYNYMNIFLSFLQCFILFIWIVHSLFPSPCLWICSMNKYKLMNIYSLNSNKIIIIF